MAKFKGFLNRIREKHDLTYSDKGSYDEKWSVKVSTLNLMMLVALYSIVLLFLTFLVINFTGLKSIFALGDSNISMEQVSENATAIDSLYENTNSTQLYLDDLKKILNDEPFDDSLSEKGIDSLLLNYQPNFDKSEEDSLLRVEMETPNSAVKQIPNLNFFFSPVKGIVSRSFDRNAGHFGVDVSSEEDEVVKSCLEGVIVYTGWDSEVGNVIIVQHPFEILSVYKHCSKLFKKEGQTVQPGDPIAIVGDSGEHSSGPHLHFELWEKGRQLNPEEYITFSR